MKKTTAMLLGPLVAALAYIMLSTTSVFAAGPYTCTWTGATNNNFNNAGNWSGCNSSYPQPGDNDNLIFDNTSLSSSKVLSNNITNLNLTSITFQGSNASDTFTINGNGISVSGGITDTMAADPYINAAITLTGDQSITTNGGGVVLGAVDTGTFTLTTLDGISITTLSGSGNVNITSDQSPNLAGLTLGPASSTYSGQITVQNTAELDLDFDGGGNNPMGTGSVVVDSGGAMLVDTALDTLDISNNITASSGAGGTNSSYGAIISCLGDSSGCTSDGNDTTLTLSGNVVLDGDTQIVNGAYYPSEPSPPSNTSTFDLTGAVNLNCYTLTAVSGSSTTVTIPANTPSGCPAPASGSSGGSGGSTAANVPKAPDTGEGLSFSNIYIPVLGSVIVVAGLTILGRRLNLSIYKKH